MKLFVTGGTGLVGSHFIRQALAAGHSVVALRRSESVARIALDVQPEWITGPLDGNFEEYMAGVDVFVHLASHSVNPPWAPLEECLYWNVFAAIKLARQAHAAGVRRFLVAGSCFEYGRAAENLDVIATDTQVEPNMSYATSKAAASLAFQGFARETGVQLKLLRLFHVFGEGEQAGRLWPSLRKAALEGADFPMSPGGQVRDFVPVDMAAARFLAHLDFVGSEPGLPTIHHVGSGQPQSVLQFAEYWWKQWGAKGRLLPGAIPYRPNEMMRLVPLPDAENR